ncbi:hypothetical protein [Wolbachia endosymbiont of Drosophila simulans]|nr:hypothetical protein [Wolbachia endosymbiont of Drosophila simulans]
MLLIVTLPFMILFQNNGVGDYKVQCNYGVVPYATDEYVHFGAIIL